MFLIVFYKSFFITLIKKIIEFKKWYNIRMNTPTIIFDDKKVKKNFFLQK